ncbi:MAG: 30S ribosomal protein S5 [Patescibacteria group bacterium]
MEDKKTDKKKDDTKVDMENSKKPVQDAVVAENVDDKKIAENIDNKKATENVDEKAPEGANEKKTENVDDKKTVPDAPETKNTTDATDIASTPTTSAPSEKKFEKNFKDRSSRFSGGKGSNQKGGQRKGRQGGKFEHPKQEFDQKIIDIRRVARVMAGGRRFSFSVAMVAGNRKGKVGVGVGKASDTSRAIEKALKNAKKNMTTIKLNKKSSIPYETRARYCTSEILLKPAEGKGIVAGSSARTVLDFAGVTNVSLKIFSRSKNKINIARAAILALNEFKAPTKI